MKILLICPPANPIDFFKHNKPATYDGVTYHRLLVPYGHIGRYRPEIEIHQLPGLSDELQDTDGNIHENAWDDYIGTFDIVVVSRLITTDLKLQKHYIDKIKSRCKLVVDFDDYWELNHDHILYDQYRNGISEANRQLLRHADLVTCTNYYLLNKILAYNKNVVIHPNVIDTEIEQFKPRPTACPLIRVGYVGGITHEKDLQLIQAFARWVQTQPNMQFVLGGFTNHPVWQRMERSITDNYNTVKDTHYLKHLKSNINIPYVGEDQQPYRRLWAKGIDEYATMYNEIDIALAPLQDNEFTRCKSNLKILEALNFGVPVICSPVKPYTMSTQTGVKYACTRNDWRRECEEIIQSGLHKCKPELKSMHTRKTESIEKLSEVRMIDLLKLVYDSTTATSH